MKYYKVSEIDLRELLTAAHYAWALESGGVDNWMSEWDARDRYIDEYNQINKSHCVDIGEIADSEILLYEEI